MRRLPLLRLKRQSLFLSLFACLLSVAALAYWIGQLLQLLADGETYGLIVLMGLLR